MSRVSPLCCQFVSARKIRIVYKITDVQYKIGTHQYATNGIPEQRQQHTDVTVSSYLHGSKDVCGGSLLPF